jgi:hypothetical protein
MALAMYDNNGGGCKHYTIVLHNKDDNGDLYQDFIIV